MKIRVRPRIGYSVHTIAEVDIDPSQTCGALKQKVQEGGKHQRLPELFYHNEPLDDARTIAFYDLQPGHIIESSSNPVWVSILFAILGDMEEEFGKTYKGSINVKTYISVLNNSKGEEPSQPRNFPTIEAWLNGVTKAPRSENLQEKVRAKYAEYKQYEERGSADPIGEFVENQINSKKEKEKQANTPPKQPRRSPANKTPKKYAPEAGSVPCALLMTLHRALNSVPSRMSLTEPDLKDAAQSFTLTDMFDRGFNGWGGFDSMQTTLIARNFVKKESVGANTRYSLTPEARELAKIS